MGNGYYGCSMSNNAVAAYVNGERPISRWTKTDIIDEIAEVDSWKAACCRDLDLTTLKAKVLKKSSQHHTSAKFNLTDFYSVDKDLIRETTPEEIEEWAHDAEADPTRDIFKGDIEYIEWSGSFRHATATERELKNVTIEKKGCFYIAYDDNGKQILKKKIGSRGTRVWREGYSYWENR